MSPKLTMAHASLKRDGLGFISQAWCYICGSSQRVTSSPCSTHLITSVKQITYHPSVQVKLRELLYLVQTGTLYFLNEFYPIQYLYLKSPRWKNWQMVTTLEMALEQIGQLPLYIQVGQQPFGQLGNLLGWATNC